MSDSYFRIAEQRILDAIAKGELDNLPGKGKPLDLEGPPPFVSREAWTMMKMLKDSGLVPREVQLLKEIHELKEQLKTVKDETERKAILTQLREREIEAQAKIESFNRK